MKKRIAVLVCILSFALLLCARAEKGAISYNIGATQTTDKVISFSGFPWSSTPENVKDFFEQQKYKRQFMDNYGPDTSRHFSSSSYGDGKIIPSVSSKYVSTTSHHYSSESYRSSAKVGGHEVLSFDVNFMRSSQYYNRMYEVGVLFSDSDYFTEEEQFDDLTTKLTALYGNPHTYTYEDEIYSGSIYNTEKYRYICNVWLGAEGTATYLERSIPLEDDDYDGSVSLYYGLTDSSRWFVETETEYLAKEETKRQEEIKKITEDFSGL